MLPNEFQYKMIEYNGNIDKIIKDNLITEYKILKDKYSFACENISMKESLKLIGLKRRKQWYEIIKEIKNNTIINKDIKLLRELEEINLMK